MIQVVIRILTPTWECTLRLHNVTQPQRLLRPTVNQELRHGWHLPSGNCRLGVTPARSWAPMQGRPRPMYNRAMGRKKKKAPRTETTKEQKRGRPKGRSRTDAVINVVATDNTFRTTEDCGSWVGKCIHCNTSLVVSRSGETTATLEHIIPLCAGGSPDDPHNLALACQGCNNRKGVEHDQHVGKGGRADQVIEALQAKRAIRWREPVQAQGLSGYHESHGN